MSLDVDIRHQLGAFQLTARFAVGAGVTGLFGPSGAGKSTIANAIAGLIRPDAGHVVQGETVLFDRARGIDMPVARRRIGYVFQDARLFPHLNVAANIRFGLRFLPRATRGEPGEAALLDMLGIAPLLSRRPVTLSGGERQRVAIARALMMQPRLLIMDEPLAALDAPRKEEVLPYLEKLCHRTGVPILYVSHALGEMARLADRLVILRQGQVVSVGTTQDILSDPALIPLIGVRDAGAVLMATVLAHDADGLTRLQIAAGELLLPGVTAPVGARIRVRVPAQDVILSVARPVGLSSRNILPVQILTIRSGDGPGMAIQLAAGSDRLLARVTARAVTELGLVPGLACHAVIKATAVPRGAIGSGG